MNEQAGRGWALSKSGAHSLERGRDEKLRSEETSSLKPHRTSWTLGHIPQINLGLQIHPQL